MILEITNLKTNEEIILKDKINLTANGDSVKKFRKIKKMKELVV